MNIFKRSVLFLLLSALLAAYLAPLSVLAKPDWEDGDFWGDDEQENEPWDEPFEYDISSGQLINLGLSVININTDSGDYVTSRLEYVGATMSIELSKEFLKCTNAYTEGALPIEIKGRGNSTWNNGYQDGKPNTLSGDTHTRKVPYNIKLSEKADLFGMGSRKNWVLVANYMDRSNLRNKLIYDLSANMGMKYTKSVFVNLVLNGEYMGVYMLCEKIDEDLFEGLVTDWNDIAEDYSKGIAQETGNDEQWQKDLEEELKTNLSWVTDGYYRIDGYKNRFVLSQYVETEKLSPYTGYLIEYDGYADEESFFITEHGVPLKIKNMEYIKTNSGLYDYIRGYFSEFEEALYSDTFYNSKGKHYSEYIDVDSFVDYYILNALILNVEFGYKSMFMYLGSDNKLVLGPCWDYDWSSGNPFLGANGDYDRWYNDGRASNNHWYHQLYGDPWFVSLVRERWFDVTEGIADMIDSMDYYYEYLSPTVEVEYDKFSSDPYEYDFGHRTGGRSFEEEYIQLKTFLENRFEWMNEQFMRRDPDIEDRGFRADITYPISVSGKTCELVFNESSPVLSDLTAKELTDLTVTVHTEKGVTYSFYVNGIFVKSLKPKSAEQSVSLDISKELLDKGVNVISVLKNVDGTVAEGINYISVSMPGQKRESVSVGRLEANTNPTAKPSNPGNSSTDDAVTEKEQESCTGNNAELTLTVILIIAAFAVPVVLIVFIGYKKLNKHINKTLS